LWPTHADEQSLADSSLDNFTREADEREREFLDRVRAAVVGDNYLGRSTTTILAGDLSAG